MAVNVLGTYVVEPGPVPIRVLRNVLRTRVLLKNALMTNSFSLADLPTIVNNPGLDLARNLARGVVNTACGIYENVPGALVGFSNSPLALALDQVCPSTGSNLPNRPGPAYIGGQCAAVYRVEFDRINPDGSIAVSSAISFAQGPLGAIAITQNPQNPNAVDATLGTATGPVFMFTGAPEGSTVNITDVIRLDGQPDDCGNPPDGQFPSGDPPTNLPPVEVPDPRDPAGPGITIPVFLPDINLDNSLDFRVDDINITLDAGGITIGGEGSGAGGGAGDNPLSPCNEEPPLAINFDTRVFFGIRGRRVDDFSTGLSWVRVTLTILPLETKQQSGNGGEDLFYAGWFAWIADGAVLPRQPINFESSLFKTEGGVTGYTVTLTNGAEAAITEFRVFESEEEE